MQQEKALNQVTALISYLVMIYYDYLVTVLKHISLFFLTHV